MSLHALAFAFILTTAAATAQDQLPLLYLPLDGTLRAASTGGLAIPQQADSQLPFRPGMRASCVGLTGDLRWKTAGCFQTSAGTVAFWLRPAWPGTDATSHALFTLYGGPKVKQPWLTNRFSLTAAKGKLQFTIYGAKADQRMMLDGDLHAWQAREWHHVAVTWSGINSGESTAVCRLYLDGRLVAEKHDLRLDIGPVAELLDIGRDSDHSPDYAQADYDEFYIYGRPLTEAEIGRAVALSKTGGQPPLAELPAGKQHADWWNDAWPLRCRVRIQPRESHQARTAFRLPIEMQQDLHSLGIRGEIDPASVRVVPCDPQTGKSVAGARPLPVAIETNSILWQMPQPATGAVREVCVYFGIAELEARIPLFVQSQRYAWPASETTKFSIPDYATDTYGQSWDFDRDGDFAGIDTWGNRPEFLRNRQVRNGVLSFDVTEDPYFIWGNMWSDSGRTHRPVAIDLKQYPLLMMRVRQSCSTAQWELYGRNDSPALLNHKFQVDGTGWQVIRIDLAREARWAGVLKAFRIDPTSHLANAHLEIDWIRLTNESLVARQPTEVWPAAQHPVASLDVKVEHVQATCGSQQTVSVRALDSAARPIAGQPLTVHLTSNRDGHLDAVHGRPSLAIGTTARRGITDREGTIRVTLVNSQRAGAAADVLRAKADFAAVESARVSVATVAGPPHHYQIQPAHPATIGESRFPLPIRVQLVDEYGNPVSVAGRGVKLTVNQGARLEPSEVTTDAKGLAQTTLHANADQAWVFTIEGKDSADLAVHPATFGLALEKPRRGPIRLLPNGYFAGDDNRPFVPLGGFYANWIQLETPNGEWNTVKSFTETNDEQKCRWMKFLHDNGTTAMRLMLRTHHRTGTEPMDIGGRVNQALLAEVLHYMDLARQFDLQFQVVVHEDYTKPMYFNENHLRLFSLPAFANEDLDRLPPEQARFLRDRRLISPIAAKYTDPDVLACQDRYVRELIPALRCCPQVFSYELENEMVACPASWARHAIETLRSVDPTRPVCVSHGGGGLLTADPLWWHRNTPIDYYTYHLYPHGRKSGPDVDYGAWVDVLTRYGRMCGPSFMGESAGDEFYVHPDVDTRRRVMRDIIWFALTNGNPGVFFWNARGAEVREFRLARQAMAQLDLPNFRRAKPKIGIDVRHPLADDVWFRTPEGNTAHALMGRYTQHYLSAGMDFDFTTQPEKYAQQGSLAAFAPPEPQERLFELPAGWQSSYLAREDLGEILIYVRNFAGLETWNYEHSHHVRPIMLRQSRPAPLQLRWKLPGQAYRLTLYDLEKQTVQSRDVHPNDVLDQGTTSHDFALVLQRR